MLFTNNLRNPTGHFFSKTQKDKGITSLTCQQKLTHLIPGEVLPYLALFLTLTNVV